MKTKESVALAAAFAAQVIFGFSFMFTKIALIPILTLFLGMIFLKEPFTLRQAIASLIILIGVYGVNRCVVAQQERDAQESEAVAVEK